MCKSIEEAMIFASKEIDVSNRLLLTSEVKNMAFFLTHSSHKWWEKLKLGYCCIQDHIGLCIIHQFFKDSNITIDRLYMLNNGFTKSSSPPWLVK